MSFRRRIMLLTAALVFAVSTVSLVSLLQLADAILKRDLGRQLLTLATTTSLIVDAHEGTLDKFIGHGMLCVLDAPEAHANDPERAVRAAVAMQQVFNRINAEHEARGERELRMGIGIHTGSVVAGSIGSTRRLEYSVLGDAVNLSSRVQGEAAGGEILITQATWKRVKDLVYCLELEPRRVKGRDEPVHLFHVLGLRRQPELRSPAGRFQFPAAAAVSARATVGTSRAEAGRVVDVRPDGATLVSGSPLPGGTVTLDVDLPAEGWVALDAERVASEELDATEPSQRYVHHLRFVGLADATRARLAKGLWRGAVRPPAAHG